MTCEEILAYARELDTTALSELIADLKAELNCRASDGPTQLVVNVGQLSYHISVIRALRDWTNLGLKEAVETVRPGSFRLIVAQERVSEAFNVFTNLGCTVKVQQA